MKRNNKEKSFAIAGGASEKGIVFGNTFNKYESSNPIVKWMMKGFDSSLQSLVDKCEVTDIHEVGCGEGFWVNKWNASNINARGSDFSTEVIHIAKQNARALQLDENKFSVCSIYDLQKGKDSASLIICCEVLEHLENPVAGIKKLQEITEEYLIVSVPREPIWRILNMARGKYLACYGNTPGHLQHWSKNSFIEFVNGYFDVLQVAAPFPWTMLLCRKR